MNRNVGRWVLVVAAVSLSLSACTGEPESESDQGASSAPPVQHSTDATTSSDPSASASENGGAAPDAVETNAPAPEESGRVTPVIVAVEKDPGLDVLRVTARVPGILEDGGECTVLLVGPGEDVEARQEAVLNVDRTECAGITTPLSELTPGEWTITVGYRSGAHQGISAAQTAVVE